MCIYAPCGSNAVHMQAVLTASGQGAVEEGDGSVDSGVRGPSASHAELLTSQKAVYVCTCILIHGICTGADSHGSVWLFLLPQHN